MSNPTLGYPSATAAVLALRGQGWSVDAIAEAIDRTPSEVHRFAYNGKRYQRRRAGLDIPTTTLSRLRSAAIARGVSADRLAQRILNTVAIENMIDAVLDDGEAY